MLEYTPLSPGVNNGSRRPHRRRSSRRHFRNGQQAAVIRAVTAAKLYLGGAVPTLAAAATACGSNVHYVGAAVILLKSENSTLLSRARCGAVPLLAAAREAKRVARLISAYPNSRQVRPDTGARRTATATARATVPAWFMLAPLRLRSRACW